MGVSRIDRLSDAQRARVNEWADRWIEIGLRTGSADRERFEAAMRQCYRYAGLPWPDKVVWVPSPLALALAGPALGRTPEAAGGPRQLIDGAVGYAIGQPAASGVRHPVSPAVARAAGDAGAAFVGRVIEGAVGDAVASAMAEVHRVAPELVSARTAGYCSHIAGQFWGDGYLCHNPSWMSFLREVCGLEVEDDVWDRARAYEATVESACCWSLLSECVIVSERPVEIHRELSPTPLIRPWQSHRLHREDGPAIVWPDGWGIWAIHGVRVPRQVVEFPETLTIEQIRSEENAEVRRVMVDRYRTERYLRRTGAAMLDDDPTWGRLWRLDQADEEPLVMVEVINSTPEPDGSSKTYWLCVPPDMSTAQAAVAWTFDLPAGEYELEAQT
jgi:uncharacterized protein DUF6745